MEEEWKRNFENFEKKYKEHKTNYINNIKFYPTAENLSKNYKYFSI